MAPASPKTMMIEMMQEEREEQQTVLDQIEDRLNESRLCPECSETPSETCYRKQHFGWCIVHERMTNNDGVCLQSPPSTAADNVTRCKEIHSDQTEVEAYWAEVEENAASGGAGFRESGEPHVH